MGFHDVTKTKASHHRGANTKEVVKKPQWPTTFEGVRLATEVRDSNSSLDSKSKLIREIVEYEASHGSCTKTFMKKIRAQVRPPTP